MFIRLLDSPQVGCDSALISLVAMRYQNISPVIVISTPFVFVILNEVKNLFLLRVNYGRNLEDSSRSLH